LTPTLTPPLTLNSICRRWGTAHSLTLFLLLFPQAHNAIRAQSTNQSLLELHHTAWTEKDGLYGAVSAIAQTPDGFLWIGTSAGLFRFDGITFDPYQATSGALPAGGPDNLHATPDGVIWASYSGGRIVSLKDGAARLYTEKDGYPYGVTKGIVQTHDGAIWAAVVGGLARFDGTSWHRVHDDWSYAHTAAQCLFVDRQDTLWVCSGTDLAYLPSGSHQFHDLGLAIPRIVTVNQSQDGTLWYSDGDKDVVQPFRSLPDTSSPAPLPPSIPIGSWTLLFPPDGSFWFGTEGGIRRLPSSSELSASPRPLSEMAETFDRKNGGTDEIVRHLFEDREGNIWAGTSGGLERFRKRRLNWIETAASPQPVINDVDGLLVVYGSDQAAELLPSHQPVPSFIGSLNHILATDHSADGSIWFLGRTNAWRWKAGKLDDFPFPKYDPHSRVYAIDTDSAGTAWASIAGLGLMKLAGGSWTRVQVLPGEPDIAPTSVETDSQGQIWLGYDARQRVAVIKGGAVAHVFGPDDGLAVDTIKSVTPLGHVIWVAGQGGLEVLRGNRFVPLTGIGGAPFPSVRRVLSTPNDGLWLSTARGILHISQVDIQSYLAGRSSSVKYELLDTESDLPEPLSTDGLVAQSTADHLTKGKLYFATISGLATIDLAHLVRNSVSPPVAITGLLTDQRSYPTNAAVVMPPRTRSFTITYTALSLTNAARNRFKVRLDGWDKQWRDLGSRRDSTYANLAPGTYTFHVIASNNDGLWNETGATLVIRILPAYYQTDWFRLICFALLAIMVWAIYTSRVNSLIKRSNDLLLERLSERERIALDLHDTFLQSVQGLLLRFHSATRRLSSDDPARALMEETLRQSDQVLLEGRGLVQDLHTTTQAAGELLEELRLIGEEYKAFNPLAFSISSTGSERTISAIISNELSSFAREALSNAFRHSGAQTVVVNVRYEKRQLVICFKDDGRGIRAEILEAGHREGHWGLRGMKERAKRMGAHLTLKSSPSTGTEIAIAIPAEIAYSEESRFTFRSLWRRN
jgi:signal transduction histidine kinase/ligand-binding sensor domain-containing protein